MPKGKARVKKIVERNLRSVVSPEDRLEIIDQLAEEATKVANETPKERVPGLIRGSTKTTYAYQDLCSMFPIVSFTPGETIPLTFQGVKVQAYENVEMHVPECFRSLYERHLREQRSNQKNLRELGIDVSLGAGTL